MKQTLTEHRFAAIFPLMEGEDFERLVADIRENGQVEPITVMNGMILDGRNRYRACREIGVEPYTIEYDGDDPLAFVLSLNLHRRHLSESQRAMVAAKLANLSEGRPRDPGEAPLLGDTARIQAVSQPDAAKLLNVGRASVQSATVVQRDAAPEIVKAVEAGRVAVSAAAQVARLPIAEQQAVAAAGERAIAEKARELREAKKAPEPAPSNIVQLGARLNVMPTEGQIERDLLAEEGAEEHREAEEFDSTKVEHRARAINGALNTFDHVRLTGREYWQVYGKSPARETFVAWVRAAKSTIDDILKEYDHGNDGVRETAGDPAAKRLPKKGRG